MIAFLCEPRHLSHPSLRILQQNCRTCDSEIPISDNFPMNHNKAQSTKNSRTKFFSFSVKIGGILSKKRKEYVCTDCLLNTSTTYIKKFYDTSK